MSPLVLSRFGMLWRRQMKYNRVVIYINVWHWWHLLNRANLSMRNYWTTMQIEVYRWKKWQRIYFLVEELPIPIIGSIPNLEDRLVRLLRNNQANSTLCFRYNDLCELDTVQLNIIAEKKGREWLSLSLSFTTRLFSDTFNFRCYFRARWIWNTKHGAYCYQSHIIVIVSFFYLHRFTASPKQGPSSL